MLGRRTIWGAGAAVLICTALLAADLLFPPPLERFLDQSVEVRAGDGSVLRTFLSKDDKWRLHATPVDVDPAYLSALLAFEDKRFDHHVGIDPIAVLRAATQNLTHGEVVSGASTAQFFEEQQVTLAIFHRPRTGDQSRLLGEGR